MRENSFTDNELNYRESILNQAILAAEENGFDLENWYYKYMIIHTHPDFLEYPMKYFSLTLILNKAENLLLFDHDFVNALFPLYVCKSCGNACKSKFKSMPPEGNLIPRGVVSRSECCDGKIEKYNWRENLSLMVLEDRPLNYIKRYLDNRKKEL